MKDLNLITYKDKIGNDNFGDELSNINNFNEIIYPNLYHKIYDKSLYKTYINDCYIIDKNIKNANIHDISDDEL